ncbi:MAG: helix-turn-helix domain-containing protein [Gammaproteobacteria bacterium]|nr:helix-turn-helix domain-containing protein [Gammaproteobacteria bacterium]
MTEETISGQTPGRLLAKERESRGWSFRDVSEQINLDEKILQALEEADYDKLPPPAFVKGYLRAYAKLLDMDPEPVVALYKQQNFQDPEIHKIAQTKSEAVSSDPLIKMISGAVIAVIFSALAYWWYSNQPNEEPVDDNGVDSSIGTDAPLSTESTALDTDSAGDFTSEQNDPVYLPVDEPLETSSGIGVEEEPGTPQLSGSPGALSTDTQVLDTSMDEPGAQAVQDDSRSDTSGLNSSLDLPTEDAAQGDTSDSIDLTRNSLSGKAVLDPVSRIVPGADSGSGSETDEPESAVVGEDILLLKADLDSWVSVVDANDNRLMYGILTSGTPRKLQGMAPFSVVFGAAPEVEATINGTVVEFSSLIRKSRTATFVIESDGLAHK